MEEIIPDGALKKEKTGREVKTDLRRTKRPPKDRNRLFQPDSLDFIRFTIGSQKHNLRGLPPIGVIPHFLTQDTDTCCLTLISLFNKKFGREVF